MNNSKSQLLTSWLDTTRQRVKEASAKVAAADREALEMKDPNEKGHVAPPAKHDGNNRSLLELPPNGNNNGEANKEHNIFNTTTPNGVGQGSYPATINGNAIDAKFNSFTAPLTKLAESLNSGVAALKQATVQVPAQQPVQTQDNVQLNTQVDQDTFSKLAHIGAAVVGSEDGQQIVQEILERRCGEQEAAMLINSAREDLYKQAAYEQALMEQYAAEMQKQAADGEHSSSGWAGGGGALGSLLGTVGGVLNNNVLLGQGIGGGLGAGLGGLIKSIKDGESGKNALKRFGYNGLGGATGSIAGGSLGTVLGALPGYINGSPTGAAAGVLFGAPIGSAYGGGLGAYRGDKAFDKSLDEALAKSASANPEEIQQAEALVKYASACEQTHTAWLNQFQTDLEKQAYAQGAMDGEEAAQAMAAGQEPTVDGAGEGLSDEDIMQVIQSMVENQEISPEDAQALVGQLDADPTLDEIAAILEQGVNSGQIAPEVAQQIAQEIMAAAQGGAPEGAPEEGAPVDPAAEAAATPEVAEAAQEGVNKAASVINSIFA